MDMNSSRAEDLASLLPELELLRLKQGRRCLRNFLTSAMYGCCRLLQCSGLSRASRTNRLRMSPIEGPPRTRMISLDDPPSSETVITYAICGSTFLSLTTAGFRALPPENTTTLVAIAAGNCDGTRPTLATKSSGDENIRIPGWYRFRSCNANQYQGQWVSRPAFGRQAM